MSKPYIAGLSLLFSYKRTTIFKEYYKSKKNKSSIVIPVSAAVLDKLVGLECPECGQQINFVTIRKLEDHAKFQGYLDLPEPDEVLFEHYDNDKCRYKFVLIDVFAWFVYNKKDIRSNILARDRYNRESQKVFFDVTQLKAHMFKGV